ncbi:plasmid stability protein [Escherichia coli]|nr:plasmid stability protein [Escherichia coli]
MTDSRRKIAFYINPENNDADAFVAQLFDSVPTRERGRLMRSLLLAGAALRQLDNRTPNVLAELLSDKTSTENIATVLTMLLKGGVTTDGPAEQPQPVIEAAPANPAINNMKGILGKK